MKLRIYWLLLFLFIGMMACNKKPLNPPRDTFIRGTNLSKLPELEEDGAVYYNKDLSENAFEIFKAASLNTGRLHLWVHPAGVGFHQRSTISC